jgi:hypothetical protein
MTKTSLVKVKFRIWHRKDKKYTIKLSTGSSEIHMKLTNLELQLIQKNAILKEGEHHFTTDFPMKGLEEGMQFKDYLEGLVEEELNSNK